MVPFEFSSDVYSLKNYKDLFAQGKTIEDDDEYLIKHMAHWTTYLSLVRRRVSVPRVSQILCSYLQLPL